MHLSPEEMQKRIIRYQDLKPCTNAFIDARTPGSDKKENFCLIGPGVSEQPGQHVHFKEAHGFNIGGARQPKGCINSQHSHDTAEVFMIHKGDWLFRWGDQGQDGEAVLSEGDVISIPTNVFRGFENVGADDGFLFAILGGDDPGRVIWAPQVFEQAKHYGMVLLADGSLVDTTLGETIPEGAELQAPTTQEEVDAHRNMTLEDMLQCVQKDQALPSPQTTQLSQLGQGVVEYPVIGQENPAEAIGAGKMSWEHGFSFRRVEFTQGGSIASHSRAEEEVIFIQSGELEISWGEGSTTLNAGDTISIPKQLPRRFQSPNAHTVAFVVRGSDTPAPALLEAS